MTAEAAEYLDKAKRCLANAKVMLPHGMSEDAGPNAYLVAFHASQALVVERTGREAKTHRGVRSEFLRLTRDDAAFSSELRAFLSRGYELKTIADYATGQNAIVSDSEAAAAIEIAERFLAAVSALIA